MKHAELVQKATDLLLESRNAENWLALYDAALASASDTELELLTEQLQRETYGRALAAA